MRVFRFLVLHSGPFFMGYKGLCQLKNIAFGVAFTRAAPENLSLFTKSQGRFNRSLPFSSFAPRTVLHVKQGFVSNESFAFRVRSRMELASVILFCTVNRCSL